MSRVKYFLKFAKLIPRLLSVEIILLVYCSSLINFFLDKYIYIQNKKFNIIILLHQDWHDLFSWETDKQGWNKDKSTCSKKCFRLLTMFTFIIYHQAKKSKIVGHGFEVISLERLENRSTFWNIIWMLFAYHSGNLKLWEKYHEF